MNQTLPLNPIGFVTKDPELKKSERTGTKYLHLNIAVNKGYGEKERAIFFQATFFGEQAERVIHAKVKKGSCIQLSGDIEDVVAFQKEDSGELFTTIKLNPYEWHFSPFASRKDGAATSSEGTAPVTDAELPPVTPENFEEVQCGASGELPD